MEEGDGAVSGEGLLADGLPFAARFQAGRVAERNDALAYLRQRQSAAETAAGRARGDDELANDRARQLAVILHDFEIGLHEGEGAPAEDADAAAKDSV